MSIYWNANTAQGYMRILFATMYYFSEFKLSSDMIHNTEVCCNSVIIQYDYESSFRIWLYELLRRETTTSWRVQSIPWMQFKKWMFVTWLLHRCYIRKQWEYIHREKTMQNWTKLVTKKWERTTILDMVEAVNLVTRNLKLKKFVYNTKFIIPLQQNHISTVATNAAHTHSLKSKPLVFKLKSTHFSLFNVSYIWMSLSLAKYFIPIVYFAG